MFGTADEHRAHLQTTLQRERLQWGIDADAERVRWVGVIEAMEKSQRITRFVCFFSGMISGGAIVNAWWSW